MSDQRSKTEILQTIRKEINKEIISYDAFGRVEFIYVAPADAQDGDPILVKQFIYYPSVGIVKGRKEGYTVWSDNIFLDVLVDDSDNFLVDDSGNQLIGP